MKQDSRARHRAACLGAALAIGSLLPAQGAFLQAPSKLFEDMINTGQPSMATTPGLLPL